MDARDDTTLSLTCCRETMMTHADDSHLFLNQPVTVSAIRVQLVYRVYLFQTTAPPSDFATWRSFKIMSSYTSTFLLPPLKRRSFSSQSLLKIRIKRKRHSTIDQRIQIKRCASAIESQFPSLCRNWLNETRNRPSTRAILSPLRA